MSVFLTFGRDTSGNNAYAPVFSDVKWGSTLSANVEQHFTIPSPSVPYNALYAVISSNPGATLFVAENATAAVPGSSFAAGTSEINPAVRKVIAGETLSFITADTTAYVTVSFYVV